MSEQGGSRNRLTEDRLSRAVAVGAVVATLLAGLVGFLLANSAKNANDAGMTADRLGLQAMGELTRSMSRGEAQYQTFLVAMEQRTHETISLQEGFFGSETSKRRHALAEERWGKLADRTAELTPITLDGVDGPERDPAFPERFFAAATYDAVRLAALQDAANEHQSSWDRKASAYVAILTIFGVTLYLFALLSVSLQTDVKRMFAMVGAALLAVGIIWTGFVHLKPAELAPPRAAEEFAKGHVALASAHNKAAYEKAIHHYTEAIRMRPTFARAFFERSKAIFLSGSPQSAGVSVVNSAEALESVTSPQALGRARQDLMRGRELGLHSSPVLGQLGFDTFTLARQQDAPDLYDESIAFTREAIELDPDEPVWHYNLGLALLGAGRYAEARDAYTDGVMHTLYVDVADRVEREDDLVKELVEAETLTNLEWLAVSEDDELSRHAQDMKGLVVGAVSTGKPTTAGSSTSMGDISLDVVPSEAQFRVGEVTGYDPRRDVLSVQLYYQGANSSAHVIPEASGVLDAQYLHGTVLPYLSTTTPPRCLPDGRYRLDLYVNGELTGQAETEAAFGNLHAAAAAPDLDIGTCVPATWQRSPKSLPGFVYGRQHPDGSRAAYLFRFDSHRAQGRLSSADFVDTAVAHLFPAGSAAVTQSRALSRFGDLEQPVTRRYTVSGKVVEARAGIDREGAAMVALVVGPSDYLQTEQPTAILDSVFLNEPEEPDQ